MLISILSILSMLLMISVVVGVHEYGHYLAMRRCGVEVPEFCIGLGPTLFERKLKDGTMFRIKPILVGGYARAKMSGENSMETTSDWQKAFIYVNGMVLSVLLAMVIMSVRNLVDHTSLVILVPYVSWAPWWVGSIVSGILEPIMYWLLTPVMLVAMVLQPSEFFHGLAGPVGIIAMGSAAVAQPTVWQSIFGWVKFTGLISAAFSGFNLIPIEPLDGGRIFNLLVGRLFGAKVVKVLQVAGLFLILGLIITAFIADGFRLFGG